MSKKIIKVVTDVKERISFTQLEDLQGNLKIRTPELLGKLKKSIIKHGFFVPVFVWENEDDATLRIIDGHSRIAALREFKKEGYSIPEIPIVFIKAKSLIDAKEKLAVVTSSYARFDEQGVAEFFSSFEIPPLDIAEIPWIESLPTAEGKTVDVGAHTRQVGGPVYVEGEDDVPEAKTANIVHGDVFELGDHRLMCGDSTLRTNVAKLMNGSKAQLVFTDPPYGISYSSNFMRTKTEKFEVIENDEKFLDGWVPHAIEFSSGFVFVWTTWKVLAKWMDICSAFGDMSNMIIWNKGGGGIGDLFKTFSTDYEIALCYHRGSSITGKRLGSVWSVGKDLASDYVHPTQKPVGLAELAIINTTNENAIVADFFGGSGSTLIACEKNNRKAFMMEYDSKYVSTIIERWQNFTGKKAYRLNADGSKTEYAKLVDIKVKKK